MALINCLECGKEISDKAESCPNCGCPTNKQELQQQNDEYLCCPKCRSKELHSEQKGFSGGKALAGAVLTGGIGLLAGTIGSKDVRITCLKCGNHFKAGEALILNNRKLNNIDQDIKNLIENDGMLSAVKYYHDTTGQSLSESKAYVDAFVVKTGVKQKNSNSGCAGIIALTISVGVLLLFI